jgi:hypothetical protein
LFRYAIFKTLEILDDAIRTSIFRSGGLPIGVYFAALLIAVYMALHAL